LPGAGAHNAACSAADNRPADRTENARSLGTIITFGKVRILDLGDLTRNKEGELVCPINKLGPVDIFIVSHHGWLQSNSPALLAAFRRASRSWTMVPTRVVHRPSVGHHQELPQTRGPLASFIFQTKAVRRTILPALYRPPCGPDVGHYLKSIGLGGRQTEVYNSRTQTNKHYAPTR